MAKTVERLQTTMESHLDRLRKDVHTSIHRCAELQREIDLLRKRLDS